MKSKNDTVRLKIEEVYKDHFALVRDPKPNSLNWIKSLQQYRVRPASRLPGVVAKKGVVRTQPHQIGLEIEDIDQENRQMQLALRFVQKYNSELVIVLQRENSALHHTWDHIENNRELSHSLTKNASAMRQPVDESAHQVGNLERNLQFQLHQLDQESRKIESILRHLRESPEFYHLLELTAIKKTYTAEMDRIALVDMEQPGTAGLSKKRMLRKLSKRVYLTDIKISDAESTLAVLETEIESSELQLRESVHEQSVLEAKLASLEEASEAQKAELHDLGQAIRESTRLVSLFPSD